MITIRTPIIKYRLLCCGLSAHPYGAGFLSPLDSLSQLPAKGIIMLPAGKPIFFRLKNSAVPSQHDALSD
jgi:hypothetical protein